MAEENVQANGRSEAGGEAARCMVGRIVGDFEIRREIGRGGMGIVYEAWQISLQRPIALKVLTNTATMTKTAVERFQREARAAAKLHHTNIVPIYAQGEHEGLYYYAMELVRGRSVYEIVQQMRGDANGSRLAVTKTRAGEPATVPVTEGDSASGQTLPTSQAASVPVEVGSSPKDSGPSRTTVEHFDTIARLTSTVADALEYAHQAGVIHRDVKPHNLILGDDGRLCVSDFGLARVLEQPGVTMTGEFLGSPLYMSPEQIRGGSSKADYRTDIYSLGATMYEWITLSPPFPGQTREQVISQIMTSEAQRPTVYNRDIPLDLETICLKAMEKDPNKRYHTAAAMAADLRRYLDRAAIQARRAGPITRARKFVLRHPVGTLTAVIVLVLLLFAGAVLKQRGQSRRKDAELEVATSKLDVAQAAISRKEWEAQQLTQEREELAEKSEELKNLVGAFTMAQLNEDPRVQAARERGDPLGAALAGGAAVGEAFGAQFSAQGPVGTGAAEPDLGTQLDAVEQEAARRLPEALISAQILSLRIALEATDPDIEPDSADAYYLQAAMSTDYEPALTLLDQALSRDPGHYNARYLRAAILGHLGRLREMLEEAKRLTELQPESPSGFLLRGASELFAGQFEPAIENLEKALALGGESAWLHALRGLCYARLDNLVLGIQAYSKALELSPDHAIARLARGRAQYYLGVYKAALDDANQFVRLVPDSVEGYVFRGECHDKLQEFDAAVADYNEAIALGGSSMRVVGKLAWAVLNVQEAAAQAAAAAERADDDQAGDEAKPQDRPGQSARPVREDNINWLNSWLEEKMRGHKPPPPAEPDASGYPFGAARPLVP